MVSPETLIRVFLLLLYVGVFLVAFRWFIPGLSQQSKRLAIIFFMAHALVIAVSLEKQNASGFEFWLWHLSREWNIPSTLASLQMALAGAAAIAASILAKERRLWERFYLLVIGLLFLYLARDEYANLHEFIPDWERLFAALGAIVVVTTLVVAWRASNRYRVWHGCFLAGLAMSGIGAVTFETERQICGIWGPLLDQRCLNMFFLEEPLEFTGIWLVLVALLGQFSAAAPAPSRRVQLALFAWPVIWLLLLLPSAAILPITEQAVSQPAAVEYEAGLRLHAFRIEFGEQTLATHLFLSSRAWDDDTIGYSIQLVDQVTGEPIASANTFLHQRLNFLLGPGYVPVYRQWAKVVIPKAAKSNRSLWIVLTLWREEEAAYSPLLVRSSDLRLLNESQVILDELRLQAEPRGASLSAIAVFENGFTLEDVDMPESVRAGQVMEVTFSWHSGETGKADVAQFLHFVHEDSGAQWGYDQQPLGARLPTRLWYKGLADSETWEAPLPADLAPGRYQIFTGLYRAQDRERVAARDLAGTPYVDARVPLGKLIVE